jgi:hypothetical protein
MINKNFKFHIVGAGRGGTSLLAGLLDFHTELEVSFERFSIPYLVGSKISYQGPELYQKRVSAYLSACNDFSAKFPDVFWGNKITTEQIFKLEDHNLYNPDFKINILDEFFNKSLENQAIVFILRDGRSCINSKIQRKGMAIEKASNLWKNSVKCYKFLKTQHLNNICIKFEDLLQDPETTLTKVCHFLGLKFQDKMLQGTNNNKMLPDYRKNTFDLSKLKSIDIADDAFKLIQQDLKYCGYI